VGGRGGVTWMLLIMGKDVLRGLRRVLMRCSDGKMSRRGRLGFEGTGFPAASAVADGAAAPVGSVAGLADGGCGGGGSPPTSCHVRLKGLVVLGTMCRPAEKVYLASLSGDTGGLKAPMTGWAGPNRRSGSSSRGGVWQCAACCALLLAGKLGALVMTGVRPRPLGRGWRPFLSTTRGDGAFRVSENAAMERMSRSFGVALPVEFSPKLIIRSGPAAILRVGIRCRWC